jgi:excisionase family DNA binding protein
MSQALADQMRGEGYISVPEAAEKLGVHQTTIRVWIGQGTLPSRRRGSRWFVKETAVRALERGE